LNEFEDGWGLSYTAASETSVARFEAAVTAYLAAQADTMMQVQDLLAAAPDMLMAVCLRGYLLRLAAHPQFQPALADLLQHARSLMARGEGNARERQHVEALTLWADDRGDLALTRLEALLQEAPMDMLALRIAHYLHFYRGLGNEMRDSTARVLPAWPQDHPHYGYLLGMHAFGLEEAGDYAAALALGQQAVDINGADIWAAHAVSHVYEMRGQHRLGLEWLDGLEGNWRDANNFRNHVIWHGALHHLGLGDTQAALAVYDQQLAATIADDFYLDMCNNAALLWRLQFLGVDVGDRWQALAGLCRQHTQDRELVFASLHYLIPLAVTGAVETSALLDGLRQWSGQAGEQGRVCNAVGVGLADAIADSIDQPEKALQQLLRHRAHSYLIGGSKAQRDLFRLLAEDDAGRAGRHDLAGAWGGAE